MIYLRIALFLGLLLHKAVWEMMKGKRSRAPISFALPPINFKTILKGGKIAFLVFLVIQTLFLSLFPILTNDIPIRIIGVIVYSAGLAIAILGRLQLGRNWVNLEDYQVITGQKLVQKGLYGYIRHPIYIGDVLLVAGLELALNSWLVLLAIPILLVVFKQAVAEEKILQDAFPGYSAYQKRTKMFVPFVV